MITAQRVRLRDLAGDDRRAALAAAAGALRDERLVVFPTDTVYGVGASAASAASVASLRSLTRRRGGGTSQPSAWHAPSAEAALSAVEPEAPAHRRLLSRLLPGPVTFIVELPPQRLDAARAALGAVPGALDNGRELAVRVPDHPLTRELLGMAGVPVIAESIGAAGWARADSLNSRAPEAASGVEVMLDDGPTRLGRPTTRVRLAADGSWLVLSEGAIGESAVRRALERTVLFVCSGNTCRSPMAAAIARHLVQSGAAPQPPGISIAVKSAGSGAVSGQPMTPEAQESLRRIGVDPGGHRSVSLTRDAIADAEAIFTMTPGHLRSVLALNPAAEGRARPLDPSGEAVEDPIGAPQEVYDRTAARLRDLIEARLRELPP